MYVCGMACAHMFEINTGATRRKKRSPIALVQNVPRIVLADDQQEVLQIVSSILEDECEIVGLARDGEQALQLARAKSPDLLVMDIFMPILNGMDAAARLKESGSLIKILFLTVYEDPDFVNAAISTGASGYVVKAHLISDLMPAIRNALAGHIYVSPTLLSCPSR